jgi:hypothetical protein
VHALADVQDTPLNTLPVAPEGLGDATMDHEVPLRFSTKLVTLLELSSELPTARHLLADAHDTPAKALAVAPEGLGVVWMDHEVPFHASARLTSTPELSL